MSGPRRRAVLVTGGSGFIGTHLCEALLRQGVAVLNLDQNPPKISGHVAFWRSIDVLDREGLMSGFTSFRPDVVVHLAARTDMAGASVADYAVNTVGTRNVCDAIHAVESVERAVFTSSQFVVGPDSTPAHELDFAPHTIYGQSKAEGERIVRLAGLDCTWTIIRPTNIWGPWHPRYPSEFWLVLRRRLYVHPGSEPVVRCYGYVGNVVWQIERILEAPAAEVSEKVLYLGDAPTVLRDWVDAFSLEITGRPVRVVPRPVVRGLGRIGDFLRWVGIPFPIFTSRVRSMTQDYLTPVQETLDTLGAGPYTLKTGVSETVAWLRDMDW